MSSKPRNMKNRKRVLPKRVPNRNVGLTMYKSVRPVMPEEFDTKLKYLTFEAISNVGATAASLRFRTEAFDVDPALGSTAMPGFTEFAAFYQRYRTLAMRYKFSIANQEAFPVAVLAGYTCSTIASGSLGIVYAGNPLFQDSILGPLTGQGRVTFQDDKTVVQVVGSTQPLYDDLYTGSTTSATLATAGTIYCHIGVNSPLALTAAGCVCAIEIELTIRFYRPNALTS